MILGLTAVALAIIFGVVKGCEYDHLNESANAGKCIPSVTLLDEPSGWYQRDHECSPGSSLSVQPQKDGKVHVICTCPEGIPEES